MEVRFRHLGSGSIYGAEIRPSLGGIAPRAERNRFHYGSRALTETDMLTPWAAQLRREARSDMPITRVTRLPVCGGMA